MTDADRQTERQAGRGRQAGRHGIVRNSPSRLALVFHQTNKVFEIRSIWTLVYFGDFVQHALIVFQSNKCM